MKTTETVTIEPTATPAPKVPQTATITLTAPNGSTLALVAQRLKDNTASSFAITTDPDKKTSRGMTEKHATFEAAKKATAVLASKAEKMGWTRREARRGFVAKPDAFTSLPAVPVASKAKK